MRTSTLLVLFVALAIAGDLGCKSKNDIVEVRGSDAEMNAAIAEAKQRWPDFVSAFATRKEGDQFSAKYPFPVPGGGHEHIWLSVTELTADRITGTIDNEPVANIGHKLGDSVTIPASEISDWLYTRAGSKEMIGGFTIKVMTARGGGR